MNAAQKKLYFFEWARARDWFAAHGVTGPALDAKRHALHVKALGHDKSSKAFTNGDLDAVLAAFRAVYDGGNLQAQLDALDAPEERRKAILEKCHASMNVMWNLGENGFAKGSACERYIEGTARNVVKKSVEDCTEAELGVVLGCIRRREAVLRKKNPERAAGYDAMVAARAAEQPF